MPADYSALPEPRSFPFDRQAGSANLDRANLGRRDAYYRTSFATAGLRAIPSDQFTIPINRSGITPIKTVANAVTASAARIVQLTGSTPFSSGCPMNMAFAIFK